MTYDGRDLRAKWHAVVQTHPQSQHRNKVVDDWFDDCDRWLVQLIQDGVVNIAEW